MSHTVMIEMFEMFPVRQVFISSSYLTVLFLIQCGEPFKEDDMIVINGTKEEVEILKHKMLERHEKAKSKVRLTSEQSVSDLFSADSKI